MISYLLKKIGSNLFKGKSIMNTSLPVTIFDKRTLLQVFAYELSLAPIYITRAYYTIDPLEKLKWITTFVVTQLHMSPILTKPFTPIIGETYQCLIGGTLDVYIEQTAPKPTTHCFYCKDLHGLYKIYGNISTEASTGANSVKATRKGNFTIELKTGEKYKVILPDAIYKGITLGNKLFNFKHNAAVIDINMELGAFVKFNPDEKGFFKSILSKQQKSYPDTFRGGIVNIKDLTITPNSKDNFINKKAKYLSIIEGEWTSHLSFDGVEYWTKGDYPLPEHYKMKFTLPSDSSNREDLKCLINSDLANAQLYKEEIEALQRSDRLLRLKHK